MNNKKNILTPDQILNFCNENKYKFADSERLLSRCIDGRYEKKEGLEPLAKAGADIGDLMTMLSANMQFALGLSSEVILSSLIKVVGGKENLRIHTDDHCCHEEDEKAQCLGCGHFKQANIDPVAYGLENEDINFILEALYQLKKDGVKNDILYGGHMEKAVIVLKSTHYSLYPMFKNDNTFMESFIYHKSLDDTRRRLLAKELTSHIDPEKKMEEEYLYEVLTSTSDQQLFETVSRLASELPIYNIEIDKEGEVKIEE